MSKRTHFLVLLVVIWTAFLDAFNDECLIKCDGVFVEEEFSTAKDAGFAYARPNSRMEPEAVSGREPGAPSSRPGHKCFASGDHAGQRPRGTSDVVAFPLPLVAPMTEIPIERD